MRSIYLFLAIILFSAFPIKVYAQNVEKPNLQDPIKLELLIPKIPASNDSSIFDDRPISRYIPPQNINEPKIYYTTKYSGLQGVMYEQIRRVIYKYCNQLQNKYGTYVQISEFQLQMHSYNIDDRWEPENFTDCFSPENGGAIYEERVIGKNIEILSIGPINLTNNGKLTFNDLWLDVSSKSSNSSSAKIDAKSEELDLTRHLIFDIGLPPERLINNKYYVTTAAIKLNLRADQFSQNNKSGATLIITTKFLYNRKPCAEWQIKAYSRPFINEWGIELSIKLLTF